jgi:hypothetical protein
MPDHPAVANLKDDVAMAAVQNPFPDGSPESEAYHKHLVGMIEPHNMHKHLGMGVEDIVGAATAASQYQTVDQSQGQRVSDENPGERYTGGAMDRYG